MGSIVNWRSASTVETLMLSLRRCYFHDFQTSVTILTAKTRIVPLTKITVSRLELLSALLLSKLMVTARDALISVLILEESTAYSDLRVALYWIKGSTYEWKQFIDNRARSIRKAVLAQFWRHCNGTDNPADLPSRGVSVSELLHNSLWLKVPGYLLPE